MQACKHATLFWTSLTPCLHASCSSDHHDLTPHMPHPTALPPAGLGFCKCYPGFWGPACVYGSGDLAAAEAMAMTDTSMGLSVLAAKAKAAPPPRPLPPSAAALAAGWGLPPMPQGPLKIWVYPLPSELVSLPLWATGNEHS